MSASLAHLVRDLLRVELKVKRLMRVEQIVERPPLS